jgi:hypothetical protein
LENDNRLFWSWSASVIVTYVYSDCSEDQFRVQLRCRNFADAINRVGWHTANVLDLNSFIQNTPEAQKLCAGSDLIVVHRYLYGPVLRAVQYWKARDKKVVVDFDQAINYLTPEFPSYPFWIEGVPLEECATGNKKHEGNIDPIPLEQFKWGLGLVDAAIVPSSRLADDWAKYTNVFELPDYLNTDQYPALNQDHESETWIGLCNNTKSYNLDSSGLLRALENICREHPQVKLVLGDMELARTGKLDIPPAQVILSPSSSFEEWSNILPKLDIGLMPLWGDYDLRSSWINLLEFMVSKIPWIASDLVPLRPLSLYGKLVQNSSSNWEAAILNALDQLGVYKKKAAGEPFLFALSQDVNGNIDKVLKLYTAIINQV